MQTAPNSINAVVLAGRANNGKLKDCAEQEWEALIDIAGRPMLAWVLDGLLGSKYVNHVSVVAPREIFAPLFESDKVTIIEPVGTMVGNGVKGCHSTPGSERILLSTSDIPLITPSVVDRFIEQCDQKDSDFYYPAVHKAVMEARFPDVVRTYASIKEGTVTGGNMSLIRRSAVDAIAAGADGFIQNRKSPLKQAGLLGWTFLIKLLLHTLTIDELERTITRTFGARVVAIISSDVEIGVDVDKPSDLALVRRALKSTV